jgi:hypothetical protein
MPTSIDLLMLVGLNLSVNSGGNRSGSSVARIDEHPVMASAQQQRVVTLPAEAHIFTVDCTRRDSPIQAGAWEN